ncbi:MAG: hypothetical protein FWH22_05870 [Fibromonadales bacterium]|nr:hypothetical protein [Fibromonadales bacterium]
MKAFSNIAGIFDRVSELRNDPLLADIYNDITNLDNLRYIGPEMDKANLKNDMQNWAGDFGKAFQTAKQGFGR